MRPRSRATVPERLEVGVELRADAADLAPGDPAGDTEGLHQFVDLASRDAVHPRLITTA